MKKAKIIYLSIIVLCLLIISTSIYFVLGGFDKVEIYLLEGTSRSVIGNEYVIPIKEFSSRMDSMRNAIEAGQLKGQLTAVIYQEEPSLRDSLRCFIGASQDSVSGVVRLPAGFEYKQFNTEKIYKIFITQHDLVKPLPEDIEEMMQVKSIEEGEILQPYTFELYYQDGSLSVEKWAK